MSILIYAEHDNQNLKPATLNVIAAAKKLGSNITLLIAGQNCKGIAETAAQVEGVSAVWVADNASYKYQLAENIAGLVAEIGREFTHILVAATTTGKNFLPRVAALLDVAQISEVIAIENEKTFKRTFYAGNAIETVISEDAIKILTIRPTAFDPVSATGGSAAVQELNQVTDLGVSKFVSEELAVSDRPELTAAKVVISGGRGMQNGENFKYLEAIADKLGAAVGASRAAVDAGFVPNDMQVGQTGKIVAPELYIAVGISGAIQHLAGMKDSKVIVAINKDPEAPIFQVADYGLVADLFESLTALEAAL
ncbi:MAG: FAD-binding protein [Pseudomonadota bacterium]